MAAKKKPKIAEPASTVALPSVIPNEDKIYEAYIMWLATPRDERSSKTEYDFCASVNIQPEMIFRLRSRATFDEDLKASTLKWAKRKTPELLHTLYKKYKDSESHQDLRLFLEAAEFLKKDKEQTPTQNIINIFNPTDEQRRQILERATRNLVPDAERSA